MSVSRLLSLSPSCLSVLVGASLFLSPLKAAETSTILLQRCAPCHGPDLNGVGGVFPSLVTSELVKKGELDAIIQFITKGSPADSKSLVKMPPKGGHLDLTDKQIRDIAKQVVELAKGYVPKPPSQGSSKQGFFTERYGPVVSSGIETAAVASWPPGESAPVEAKALYAKERKLLEEISKTGAEDLKGLSLEELTRLRSADLSKPGDKVEGTSGNFPGGEVPNRAIDDKGNTKYLNFDGPNSGLVITTSKGVISGLSVTSAIDSPERDPRSYLLSGSNDGMKFTEIARGEVPAFSARFQEKAISFPNDKAYSTYKLVFPTLAGKGDIPMQIAEIELLRKQAGDSVEKWLSQAKYACLMMRRDNVLLMKR